MGRSRLKEKVRVSAPWQKEQLFVNIKRYTFADAMKGLQAQSEAGKIELLDTLFAGLDKGVHMITPNAGIAPEGKPFIFITAFAALIFALVKLPCLALISLLLCIFTLQFFRDPERVVPAEENVAVSPADGRILHVSTRKDPFDGEERCCISIFMNVFNVHVNRVPVDCRVVDMKYFPGTFVNASLDKASENNERCAWKLEENSGEIWSMVQIAGLIARRIVCRAGRGDYLGRGERCGIIRFGSRVDLYLPANYRATVQVGEHVVAGLSILARKS